MAVKPDYRESGVGTRLVNAAVSAIKSEDVHNIHCLVKRDNLIAQQFWEACSFVMHEDLYDFSLR